MEIEVTGQILAAGDFARLIDQEEDLLLEVKSQPYDLDTADGRYELAKDIASFANSEGGYLLIGLNHSQPDNRQVDVISGLALITRDAFPVEVYEGMVGTHVYPRIEGLAVRFYERAGGGDGLGTLLVPPQDEDRKPFIVAKVVEDRDRVTKQIVVGYADRSGTSNDPLNPKRLQEILRKGQSGVSLRLTRLEQKVDELLERGATPEAPQHPGVKVDPEAFDRETLQERINTSIADAEE